MAGVTLVSAPAGAGKTTLVADWLRQDGRPFAWLSLDEFDNSASRFTSHLVHAVQSVIPDLSPTLKELQAKAPPEAVIESLVRGMEAVERLVLVLDDYHLINDPGIHALVRRMIDLLPVGVLLVLVTRVDPMLPLARLRLNGRLTEIRERDLSFTTPETATFLSVAAPNRFDDAQAEVLHRKTEGWIAGLKMAAISVERGADPAAFVHSFAGSNQLIVEYLAEEVLGGRTPEQQRFLMRSAILSSFDAELCAQVLAEPEAERLLADVRAANLFLVSLDDESRWFRYHHLFAELLVTRFRRSDPDGYNLLRQQAATWYEAAGNLNEALRHAAEMRSPDLLIRMLDRHGLSFIMRSELGDLDRWRRSLPDPTTLRTPRLLVALALLNLLTTHAPDLDDLIDAARAALESPDVSYPDRVRRETDLLIEVVRAYSLRFRDRLEESIDLSTRLLRDLPEDLMLVRGALEFNRARGLMRLGRMDEAAEVMDLAIPAARASGNHYIFVLCQAHLGAILLQTRGTGVSMDHLEMARIRLEAERLSSMPVSGMIHVHLGRALYLRGEPGAAVEAFERAISLAVRGREPELHTNALVGLVRAKATRGDHDGARATFAELEEIYRQDGARTFDTSMEAEALWLQIACGQRPQNTDAMCVREGAPFTTSRETEALLHVRAAILLGWTPAAEESLGWLRAALANRNRRPARISLAIAEEVIASGDVTEKLVEAVREAIVAGYPHLIAEWATVLGSRLQNLAAEDPTIAEALARLVENGSTFGGAPLPTVPAFRQQMLEPLTEREQEVIFHLSRGLSNRDIAAAMFVSLDTVKTHLKHIFAKLGVTDRREAVERARVLGLFVSAS
jgi:LuxR family transcriptional regulator, maltose regulon positive regulatory protein